MKAYDQTKMALKRLQCASLLLCAALLRAAGNDSPASYSSWTEYGGSPDAAQYSALNQIDAANVSHLQIAWTYPTGDASKYLFNPICVHGLLYVLARSNSVVALDAKTGREVWVHGTGSGTKLITNRGINYWESKNGTDRRLLLAINNHLQAIDARTGTSIPKFGNDGEVDLRRDLGRDPETLSLVQSTTPGKVFEDLLILGSATNEEYGSAPGDVRAYNVRTGNLVWAFHTVPHPGEFGYQTWPREAWKTVGGANAWSELALDVKRGIVFVPTASPKYNFYGANRKGANLFGDCLLALDARTGKRIWHFQMVHHDIWDYDNATAPKLLTVQHDGKMVDVVAQVGKEGFVWVFNRVTGEPLWPIEERPVPRSDMPGEETWPTQPFPSKPPAFARQTFTADDLSPFIENPAERARWHEEISGARNDGMFTPPSLRNTVEMPGNNGGANFGGAAVDPTNGTLYVVSKDLPAMLRLEPVVNRQMSAGMPVKEAGKLVYGTNCQICHGENRLGQPPAVPSLVGIGQRVSADQLASIIKHGQGQMPAFSQIPNADLHALSTYLLNTKHTEVDEKAPSSTDRVTDVSEAPAERYRSGFGFMFSSSGLPVIAPPWTSLTAYNLNTGNIQWKIPLGEVPELAEKGIRNTGSHFPKVAPVVTAGGLLFAGTRDRKLRALDSRTGAVLWETELAAGLEVMKEIYELDGR